MPGGRKRSQGTKKVAWRSRSAPAFDFRKEKGLAREVPTLEERNLSCRLPKLRPGGCGNDRDFLGLGNQALLPPAFRKPGDGAEKLAVITGRGRRVGHLVGH